MPVGEDDNREIDIAIGEVNHSLIDFVLNILTQIVLVSCGAGGEFDHETVWEDGPVYARCKGGSKFEVWTDQTGDEIVDLEFRDFGCRAQPADSNEVVGKMINEIVFLFLIL